MAPVGRLLAVVIVAIPGLVACESTTTPAPDPSARPPSEPATTSRVAPGPTGAVSSRAPSAASPARSATGLPSAAAVASGSASAAADPCLPGAKRYDEPRFCVVLPDKPLEIAYEGGPEEGSAQLEVRAEVLRLSWVPLARLGKESLKEQLERVSAGEQLAGSGDMPGGAWSDVKLVGDPKGKHVVQSAVKTRKLLVNCHYTVQEAQVEQARDVCKSVRGY